MNEQEIFSSIRKLLRQEQPDYDLTELFMRHNCPYLLGLLSSKKTPQQILSELAVKERFSVCKDIFFNLEKASIPYAVVKGAVLSQAAYDSPFCRQSGDIDVLVSRGHIDSVKQLMLAAGFLQGRVTSGGLIPFTRKELLFQSAMSHQTAPFIKETKNPLCPYVNVDVNFDILWGESDRKTDMDSVLGQTEQTVVCGVSFRKLTCEMEFIALCLHHYKDMNSLYLLAGGSLRLGLFCDLYFYLKHNPPHIERLIHLSEQLQVREYVSYCIFYANEVFADPVLLEYYKQLKNEKTETLLNSFGLSDEERQEWQITFGERLFSADLTEYFSEHLSEKEREKIQMNRLYM